jgi:hypothetical protein
VVSLDAGLCGQVASGWSGRHCLKVQSIEWLSSGLLLLSGTCIVERIYYLKKFYLRRHIYDWRDKV